MEKRCGLFSRAQLAQPNGGVMREILFKDKKSSVDRRKREDELANVVHPYIRVMPSTTVS